MGLYKFAISYGNFKNLPYWIQWFQQRKSYQKYSWEDCNSEIAGRVVMFPQVYLKPLDMHIVDITKHLENS